MRAVNLGPGIGAQEPGEALWESNRWPSLIVRGRPLVIALQFNQVNTFDGLSLLYPIPAECRDDQCVADRHCRSRACHGCHRARYSSIHLFLYTQIVALGSIGGSNLLDCRLCRRSTKPTSGELHLLYVILSLTCALRACIAC